MRCDAMSTCAALSIALLLATPRARAEGAEPDTAPRSDKPAPPSPAPLREVRDGLRLRGGFSLDTEAIFVPAARAWGIGFGPAGRLGVQMSHRFSIYYQSIVTFLFLPGEKSKGVSFSDYNSFLVNLTFLHAVEVGAGPSLDYVGIAACKAGGDCFDKRSLAPGVHGRFAYIVGGLLSNGPRRSGVVLGSDIHASLFDGEPTLSFNLGVGGEWY